MLNPALQALLSSPVPAQTNPLFINPNTPNPPSMVEPGNTDLRSLPVVNNPDGSYSTVNSTSFTDEKPMSPTYGKEVLVRGILNGKKLDPENNPSHLAALKDEYYKTGKHLGIFRGRKYDDADSYATALHQDWADGKIPGVAMPSSLASALSAGPNTPWK